MIYNQYKYNFKKQLSYSIYLGRNIMRYSVEIEHPFFGVVWNQPYWDDYNWK